MTKQRAGTTKRFYDDACGTAHALELIGDRWALLVLREMMLGPRRFTGLRSDLPGISANVLSQRLGELEARGLVERRMLPPPASAQVYALTPWGEEAEPILQAMGRWAARSPEHDPSRPISATSVLLSLRTMHDPARVGDLDIEVEFRFGERVYRGYLDRYEFPIRRSDGDEARPADLVFDGTPEDVVTAIYAKVPPARLPGLTVDGDPALARAFIDCFALPPKAG